jgi:hypothetical protein
VLHTQLLDGDLRRRGACFGRHWPMCDGSPDRRRRSLRMPTRATLAMGHPASGFSKRRGVTGAIHRERRIR